MKGATHFIEVWQESVSNEIIVGLLERVRLKKMHLTVTKEQGSKTLQIWLIKFKDASNPQHSDTYLNYMSSLTSGAGSS